MARLLGIHGRDDVSIPKHSRVHNTRPAGIALKEKEKRLKTQRSVKPVNLDIFIPSVVSVGNLARLLNVRLDNLRRKMVNAGMQAEAAYDHMLTAEYASLLAMEYGRNPVVNDEAAFDIYPPPPHPDQSTLPARPPVVTIMGHVDHGKTTLLDTLRSTSVAKGEAGGITQHIGAFSVPVPAGSGGGSASDRTITFLDTPGHAAFSAMRARGAGVTDIIVLVVAADDGIMPQTREVIELIKKDNTSVVVAINKMDKPGADVSKVETALLAESVQLEAFGGDIPSVPVSGLTGQGLDQLVETISLLAEMQDLRAEREGKIQGYVLESRVQKGLGPVATVLLLRGCLKPGDHLICGLSHAKVRVLSDSNGKAVKVAYPGMAVTVSGWKELPKAGDEALKGTEAEVKKALANRIRKAEMEATLGDMEAINEQRRLERELREKEASEEQKGAQVDAAPAEKQPEGPKELRLIIKGDVSGSVEAVAGALEGIGNNVARVKIIATGVGDVTESDVMRAKAVDGTVVAFSVNVPRPVQAEAASQQVPLLSSTIIYRLMDDVKSRVIALLPPIVEKRVTGEASVLQMFDIHLPGRKILKVAGCRVTNGVVEKNKLARVIRDGETLHEGRLETLKHHKKDIMETGKGTECGMGFERYDDLRAGDMIQMYQEVEKPGSL
ncbi:initiation factor 2 [Amylocystis lapponica]|nr:initiation factor 2 [Amylocystis lapponica]